MSIGSYRRYCLLKARYHEMMGDLGLAAAWRGKHNNAPGSDLPISFPSRLALAAAAPPYTTIEDVLGASAAELIKYAGLSRADAAAVVVATEGV